METLKSGSKCFYETLRCLIPAKVVTIFRGDYGSIRATVMIEQTMAGYTKGEIVQDFAFHCPPVASVRHRTFRSVIMPFNYEVDINPQS